MLLNKLIVSKNPTREIITLLSNNVIGTPNHGMLYQHLNVETKINAIAEPYFVSVCKRDGIIGTSCFCKRTTFNGRRSDPNSFYIRYFSLKESYRKPYFNRRRFKRNTIREDIGAILNSDFYLSSGASGRYIYYAYVDPNNIRSARLCREYGFEVIRKFETIIFSRIRLNRTNKHGLSKLSGGEYGEMLNLLRQFYKDHNLVSFDNLFNGQPYYVIRSDDGEVLAGAQANPDKWKIHKMKNGIEDALLRVSSYIPYLNRVINKNFDFIGIDGLYYKRGYQRLVEPLLEGLLMRYKLHNAFIPLDCDSELYRNVIKLNLGLTNRLTERVKTDVICKLLDFTAQEVACFASNPAYVSAIDIT